VTERETAEQLNFLRLVQCDGKATSLADPYLLKKQQHNIEQTAARTAQNILSKELETA